MCYYSANRKKEILFAFGQYGKEQDLYSFSGKHLNGSVEVLKNRLSRVFARPRRRDYQTNLHSYDSGSGLLPVAWGLIICQDHRGVVCYVCDGNDSGLENNQKKIIRSRDRDIHCSFPIIIFRCDLPSRRNVTPSTQTGDFADRHLGFVLKFSLPSIQAGGM